MSCSGCLGVSYLISKHKYRFKILVFFGLTNNALSTSSLDMSFASLLSSLVKFYEPVAVINRNGTNMLRKMQFFHIIVSCVKFKFGLYGSNVCITTVWHMIQHLDPYTQFTSWLEQHIRIIKYVGCWFRTSLHNDICTFMTSTITGNYFDP